MATFEEPKSTTFYSVGENEAFCKGYNDGAASRDAEIANWKDIAKQAHDVVTELDNELSGLRAPMECGHVKAYWRPVVRYEHVVNYICTVCAELDEMKEIIADLRSKIEAARKDERERIRAAIINDQATGVGDYSDAEDYAARIIGE